MRKAEFAIPEISVEELSIALYKANQQLMDVNRKLIDSERMRLEMFSNLSHDIRSPLTSLKSYIEYLLSFDSINRKELCSILNHMHTKINSIDYLINDLLLVSSLDTPAKNTLSLEPVYLIEYLEDFFYSCKHDKKYKDRILKSKFPKIFNHYVLLDSKLFLRVLENLFTNALKFSSKGDTLCLSVKAKGENIIISISDTGKGIKEEYLNKIFERTFMISEARTSKKNGGYGLGLSIALSIVTKHNGTLWCESSEGVGSTFFISLPKLSR